MQLGLELVVMGMGTVFSFLVLLIFCTTLMSKAVMAIEKNMPQPAAATPTPISGQSKMPDGVLAAIITAAIHKHRSNKT